MNDQDLSPRTNSLLLGHQAAEAAFADAWASQRMAHAWLICGPRGIGKATLAYRMARFVLAGGGGGGLLGPAETLDVPPDHPAARHIAAGAHPDLRVVERSWTDDKMTRLKSEIPVDDVRGIGGFLSLTAADGGWRVVILDAVDELNRSGANAILKVLEEPPRRALMLVITHSPGRVLPTIRSRCRRLVLRPLEEGVVIELLRRYRPNLDPDDARAIARLAEGSIGKALDLESENGLELYRDMVKLMAGLPRLDVAAIHRYAERAAKGDEAFRTANLMFSRWVARAAARGPRSAGEGADVVAGESEIQRRLAEMVKLDRLVEVWEKTNHLFDRADAVNLDRKQVVMNAFFALEQSCRS